MKKFQEEKTSSVSRMRPKEFGEKLSNFVSKLSHTLAIFFDRKKRNKKIKSFKVFFLEFSTKNFFAFKTWLRCSEKYRLTIFISLMVAIDLTKRFIRTTAGPSKDVGILVLVNM